MLGILVSALVFAWEHAKQIEVKTRVDEEGRKIYELTDTVFFAWTANFQELFTPREDPEDVIVEFRRAKVMDHSALEAIDGPADKYQQIGKRLHLRHLSPDCYELLKRAQSMVEVNLMEAPRYHVADDQISQGKVVEVSAEKRGLGAAFLLLVG